VRFSKSITRHSGGVLPRTLPQPTRQLHAGKITGFIGFGRLRRNRSLATPFWLARRACFRCHILNLRIEMAPAKRPALRSASVFGEGL